jgi:hypothetical protein
MTGATFRHKAFQISDSKDIDLNGQNIINAIILTTNSAIGYLVTQVNTQSLDIGIAGAAQLHLAPFAGGGLSGQFVINGYGVAFPIQLPTASAPAYQKGGLYFDTTLNKLRIGGATAWETITSV